MTTGDDQPTRRCEWCAAPTVPGQQKCSGCGAALVPVESPGDLDIPGLTQVATPVESYSAPPVRIFGFGPRPSRAGGVIESLASGGGPVVEILGTLAALAAHEYLTDRPERRPTSADRLGAAPASAGFGQILARATGRTPEEQPGESFEETMRRLDARLAPEEPR